VTSLLLSALAFLVAGYFIRRQLDNRDIPKGAMRSLAIFVLALAVSYGVAFVMDLIAY
jgi:VIT1/CCC1 family predicted Fe2+/Mn2+ transporter